MRRHSNDRHAHNHLRCVRICPGADAVWRGRRGGPCARCVQRNGRCKRGRARSGLLHQSTWYAAGGRHDVRVAARRGIDDGIRNPGGGERHPSTLQAPAPDRVARQPRRLPADQFHKPSPRQAAAKGPAFSGEGRTRLEGLRPQRAISEARVRDEYSTLLG